MVKTSLKLSKRLKHLIYTIDISIAKKILTFQRKNTLRVSLFASIKATGILRPFSSLSHMPGSTAHLTQTGDSESIPTVKVQKTWEPGDGGEMKGITDLWQGKKGENRDKRQQRKRAEEAGGIWPPPHSDTSHSCSHLAAIHTIPVTIHSLKSHFLFTFTQTANLESRPGHLSLPSMFPATITSDSVPFLRNRDDKRRSFTTKMLWINRCKECKNY